MADLTDRTTRALTAALGCDLRLTERWPWIAATFSGETLAYMAGAELPDGLDEMDVPVPGAVIADLAAHDGRTLKVLVLATG